MSRFLSMNPSPRQLFHRLHHHKDGILDYFNLTKRDHSFRHHHIFCWPLMAVRASKQRDSTYPFKLYFAKTQVIFFKPRSPFPLSLKLVMVMMTIMMMRKTQCMDLRTKGWQRRQVAGRHRCWRARRRHSCVFASPLNCKHINTQTNTKNTYLALLYLITTSIFPLSWC